MYKYDLVELKTARLTLTRPVATDLAELHKLYSDRRMWINRTAKPHKTLSETQELLDWMTDRWEMDGLGPWAVRESTSGSSALIGSVECMPRPGNVWNLGYCLAPERWGKGYAQEAAAMTLRVAELLDPNRAVTAKMLERNTSSRRVAEHAGLRLVGRCPGSCNDGTDAVQLFYSDRPMDATSLKQISGGLIHSSRDDGL